MKQLKLFLITTLFTAATANAGVTIIGGDLVNANEQLAKRTVGLILFSLDAEGKEQASLCTGEIVDQSHILTAAHCISHFTAGYAVFTQNDIIEAYKNAEDIVVPLTHAKMMPGYDANHPLDSEFPDFAMLTFNGGLPAGYEPAQFLSETEYFKNITVGHTTTLSGYGVTSVKEDEQTIGVLRKVNVKVAEFSEHFMELFVEGPKNHIACSGDSGGPAVANVGNEEFVIGVASRSDCESFSIYSVITQEMVNQFVKY